MSTQSDSRGSYHHREEQTRPILDKKKTKAALLKAEEVSRQEVANANIQKHLKETEKKIKKEVKAKVAAVKEEAKALQKAEDIKRREEAKKDAETRKKVMKKSNNKAGEASVVPCAQCGENFSSGTLLHQHVLTVHVPKKGKYVPEATVLKF